jgi:hypothetical protein
VGGNQHLRTFMNISVHSLAPFNNGSSALRPR